jgi:hypothetical protein
LIHSHCHDDVNSFLFQFLIFSRIFLVARYRAGSKKHHIDSEYAYSDSGRSEYKYMLEMSAVQYRAPGVHSTKFWCILIISIEE